MTQSSPSLWYYIDGPIFGPLIALIVAGAVTVLIIAMAKHSLKR